MEKRIDIPDGVEVAIENGTVAVSSDEVTVEKRLDHPDIAVTVEDGTVVVTTASEKRDRKALVGTYAAHVRNLIEGVTRGFEYRMQGFYQHFPMDMQVQGDTFVISNFIGERATREVAIPETVSVEIDGEDVTVAGPDKDAVGQTAANIEQACYKGDRDPRKFQDGIYITGREVGSDE